MSKKPQETAADLPFDPTPAANEAAPSQALATLPPAARAVLVLNSAKAEQELRELVVKSSGILTVVDANGRQEAHNAGMKLKNARVTIKNTGKAAREDATAFSNAVIAEEKRLVALIETEEERIFKLRDDFDAKIKAEKEEAERRERERVDGIKAKIAAICGKVDEARNWCAEDLRATCANLAALVITADVYAEFTAEAQRVLDATGGQLATMYQAAKAREEEAARLAAEAEAQRIEAARLTAERAAQEKAAAELAAQQDEQSRAMAAVQQIQALGATTGNAFSLQQAIDSISAIPDFAPPVGDMVTMAKGMTIPTLAQRLAVAKAEETAAEEAALAAHSAQQKAEDAVKPTLAGVSVAPQINAPIDWDAPAPTVAPATPSAPLPESWSATDEAVTDAEIIETVSAHYGWNWIDAVERTRKIDFDKAREEA